MLSDTTSNQSIILRVKKLIVWLSNQDKITSNLARQTEDVNYKGMSPRYLKGMQDVDKLLVKQLISSC